MLRLPWMQVATHTWKTPGMECGRKRKRVRLPSRTNGAGEEQAASSSGSSASTCERPRTASTSARPCAAPDRSTLLFCAGARPVSHAAESVRLSSCNKVASISRLVCEMSMIQAGIPQT